MNSPTPEYTNDATGPVLKWAPAALVLVAGVIAALPPLHEMDLAQHLATGEWIVRHRAVPFTEPFAWTRTGQPYFAYSWLVQALYYLLLRAFGPIALHLLQGALVAGAVAAALWAGRKLGWSPGVRIAIALLHLALLWGVANILRPQQVLLILVPLAWGLAAHVRTHGTTPRVLAAIVGIGVLSANTHIFFPITILPFVYFLCTDRAARRWLGSGLALVVGWLISPYALVWPRVFALNFGHNVLLQRPPSVAEFVPGFEYALHRPGVIVAVLALLLVPWLVLTEMRRGRDRVTAAVFWTLGLALFAFAGRLVFVWWALAFALVGPAADHLRMMLSSLLRARIAPFLLAAAGALVLLVSAPPMGPVFWLFEGDAVHRMLPRAAEDPALWLPGWLLCHTRPHARGNIFTEFNYGSELTWRLPGYSPSIDGRTIFPDSDAIEFSFAPYGRRRTHASTWSRADLALVDRSFWVAPVLDADTGWILVAQGRRTSRGTQAGLWAKREWWGRWGMTSEVPALDVFPTDRRGTCAVTGVFPRL